MSEKNMRAWVVRELRRDGVDAVAVEALTPPGFPDVSYADGLLELKWLPAWPARPDTPVRVDHFTREQRLLLRRRWLSGGDAWLLLQVENVWMLFDGETAAAYVGDVNRAGLLRHARLVWVDRPVCLARALRRDDR